MKQQWVRGVFKNALWLSIADTASRGLDGIVALVLARFYGPFLYGQYAIVSAIGGTCFVITVLGFEQEFTRRAGWHRDDIPQYFTMNLVSVLMTSLLAYGLIVLVLFRRQYSAAILHMGLLMGGVLMLQRFVLPFRHLCLVLQRSIITVRFQVAISCAVLSTIGVLIVAHKGIDATIYAQGILWALGVAAWLMWVPRTYIKGAVHFNDLARYSGHSLQFALSNIIWILYFHAQAFILSWSATAADVGIYAAVFRIFALTYIVGYALANAFTPVLFEKHRHRRDEFRDGAFVLLMTMTAVSAPLALVLYFGAGRIIPLIIGAEYTNGVAIARVLAGAIFFRLINFAFSEILTTSNHQKKRVIMESILLATNITINCFCIPRYGGMGAAYANVIAEAVYFVGAVVLLYGLWRRHGQRVKQVAV